MPVEEREKLTNYELEIISVVKVLKGIHYLSGRDPLYDSNRLPFVQTMKEQNISLRVVHWILLPAEYRYTMEHCLRTALRYVDTLSCHPIQMLFIKKG